MPYLRNQVIPNEVYGQNCTWSLPVQPNSSIEVVLLEAEFCSGDYFHISSDGRLVERCASSKCLTRQRYPRSCSFQYLHRTLY